ncbi:hypothetical protein ACHAXS_010054, partial [Conticribra weissflogii]
MRLPRQNPPPLHDVAPQRHQTALQVSLDPLRQLPRVPRHLLPVVSHLPLHLDPELRQMRRVLHLPHAARRRQEGLGGDAAAVDARAADVLSREDGRAEGLGAGVEGGAVAADAAADD